MAVLSVSRPSIFSYNMYRACSNEIDVFGIIKHTAWYVVFTLIVLGRKVTYFCLHPHHLNSDEVFEVLQKLKKKRVKSPTCRLVSFYLHNKFYYNLSFAASILAVIHDGWWESLLSILIFKGSDLAKHFKMEKCHIKLFINIA